MTRKTLAGACFAALPFAAPVTSLAGPGAATPNQEALAVLREFVRPGADTAALSQKLRPTKADYDAVFGPGLAAKLRTAYEPAWDQGTLLIAAKPGQREVLLWGAGSEEIKAWSGAAAQHFPAGWKQVAQELKPGLRLYAFKFVVPGETLGMAFDGLVRVNGQWRIFPKPWRALATGS